SALLVWVVTSLARYFRLIPERGRPCGDGGPSKVPRPDFSLHQQVTCSMRSRRSLAFWSSFSALPSGGLLREQCSSFHFHISFWKEHVVISLLRFCHLLSHICFMAVTRLL